jgi:hypothetical protein
MEILLYLAFHCFSPTILLSIYLEIFSASHIALLCRRVLYCSGCAKQKYAEKQRGWLKGNAEKNKK